MAAGLVMDLTQWCQGFALQFYADGGAMAAAAPPSATALILGCVNGVTAAAAICPEKRT